MRNTRESAVSRLRRGQKLEPGIVAVQERAVVLQLLQITSNLSKSTHGHHKQRADCLCTDEHEVGIVGIVRGIGRRAHGHVQRRATESDDLLPQRKDLGLHLRRGSTYKWAQHRGVWYHVRNAERGSPPRHTWAPHLSTLLDLL